jgi:hypothetical protein
VHITISSLGFRLCAGDADAQANAYIPGSFFSIFKSPTTLLHKEGTSGMPEDPLTQNFLQGNTTQTPAHDHSAIELTVDVNTLLECLQLHGKCLVTGDLASETEIVGNSSFHSTQGSALTSCCFQGDRSSRYLEIKYVFFIFSLCIKKYSGYLLNMYN